MRALARFVLLPALFGACAAPGLVDVPDPCPQGTTRADAGSCQSSPDTLTDAGTTTPAAPDFTLGNWEFYQLVDLATPNPTGLGPFTNFDLEPALEDGVVYFRATTLPLVRPPQSTLADSLLRLENGRLEVLAKKGTALPGSDAGLTDLDALVINPPHVSHGVAVFLANGDDDHRGLYTVPVGASGGRLDKVMDRQTLIPGTNLPFYYFGEPLIDAGTVTLAGRAFAQPVGGAFAWRDGTLSLVAGFETQAPGTGGPFTSVGVSALIGDRALLMGSATAPAGATYTGPQRGIYEIDLGSGRVATRVDRSHTMPDREAPFFVMTGPLLEGDTLLFHGRADGEPCRCLPQASGCTDGQSAHPACKPGPFGTIQHKGLYVDRGRGFEVVANTTQVMPGGTETFSAEFANGLTSQYIGLDDGNVLFRGVGTTGDRQTRIGLYLWDGRTGERTKIIDTQDTFPGGAAADILIGRQAMDGGEVVFRVEYENGGIALFLARRAGP